MSAAAIRRIKITDLRPTARNPNRHTPRGLQAIEDSAGEVGAARSGVVDRDGVLLAGNGAWEALQRAGVRDALLVETDGSEWVVVQRSDLVDGEVRAEALKIGDNRASELGLEWDNEILDGLMTDIATSSEALVDSVGFREDELEELLTRLELEQRGVTQPADTLQKTFGVPPFTVLDARQGYWQERKRAWLALGLEDVAGRPEQLIFGNTEGMLALIQGSSAPTILTGTSRFDPVLAELACTWFCREGGSVFDPFAGGATRGVVATRLGLSYTGIDLSETQIAANYEQAHRIVPEAVPTWIAGNSLELDDLLSADSSFDMVFTCPPYFDLERYSDDADDLSNYKSYDRFLDDYSTILRKSMARLKNDRYACIVVGNMRDRQGLLRNFVSDTIAACESAGAALYNDAILVTPLATAIVRARRTFVQGKRKLTRTHQHVLIFVKGDPARANAAAGEIAVDWESDF